MTDSFFSKAAIASLACLLLGACKVTIEVPDGGWVKSESGSYDCEPPVSATQVAAFSSGNQRSIATGDVTALHDENFHCDVVVSNTGFDESFTAVPYEGYEFVKWSDERRGAFFGGSTDQTVRLFTSLFEGIELFMDVLASDLEFFMEPVFRKISKDGNDTDCSQYDGSFDRIQAIIFDGYNCTSSGCHGGGASAGGLDLRPDNAYNNLFRVTSTANLPEPLERVHPGEQALSFLYLKLDAATNGTALPQGGGSPMPLGGLTLTDDHLEAMRLWIRNGAPETSDVDDVASLLGCSAPTAPTANKITPPDPPPMGEGVQFVSGPWTVLPDSENEVCFATYYDLEKTPEYLPQWTQTACEGGVYSDYDGSCMAVNTSTLTQDPQSHHSIISVYVGAASPLDPSWGDWQCLNGPSKGMSCDPTRIGEPVSEGGADCGGDLYVCGTEPTKSIACRGWGAGDQSYRSVSMGGAQSPVYSQEAVPGVYSILPTRGVIIWNSHAFNLSDAATTVEQYNNYWFAPQDGRQYRRRGIFDAKDIFIANVPPYDQRTYCSHHTLPEGTRLTRLSSHAHKRGVLWQTWLPPQDPACTANGGCSPNTTTADYVSRVYNDPLYLEYDPPLAYDSPDPADRTLKFCVTYDNGDEFPDLLKRNSTSVGTKCNNSAYCVGGATPGLSCGNDDSICGDGGSCDACVVRGGVTTEDEMFLMLGTYYVVPESER